MEMMPETSAPHQKPAKRKVFIKTYTSTHWKIICEQHERSNRVVMILSLGRESQRIVVDAGLAAVMVEDMRLIKEDVRTESIVTWTE
jgi:hypothetical protein